MRKAATGCLAVVAVLAVLVAIVVSLGAVRDDKIRESAPLTLQELDRLLQEAAKPAVADQAVPPPDTREEAPAEEPAAHPEKLARAATDNDREVFRRRDRRDKVVAFLGTSPLGAMADMLSVAAGRPEGELFNRGGVNLISGNWRDAKVYFTEYVRKSKDTRGRQVAFGYLAWLEEDPDLAARYMELASADSEHVFAIRLCRDLSRATGSTELARHYEALFDSAVATWKSREREQ